MLESSCFRTHLESQRVHVSQTLLKSGRQDFYPNFPLTKDKLSSKTSLSVIPKIWVLYVNKLTADHMYSRHNWENFAEYVQRPLTQKWKTFSGIFIQFSNSTRNFAHVQNKDEVHSFKIWEVIEPEKCVDLNALRLLFNSTLPESTC